MGMAIQKWWVEIPLTDVTLGTRTGEIVFDIGAYPSINFIPYRVKMVLNLQSSGGAKRNFVINRIYSNGSVFLGIEGESIKSRADLASMGFGAPNTLQAFVAEQEKKIPDAGEIEEFTYEQEPVNARRVYAVGDNGEAIGTDANPFIVNDPSDDSLAPDQPFDEVDITRDTDDDPTTYTFSNEGTAFQAIDVTYNENKSAVKYKKRKLT
jgi:hypothetical protein